MSVATASYGKPVSYPLRTPQHPPKHSLTVKVTPYPQFLIFETGPVSGVPAEASHRIEVAMFGQPAPDLRSLQPLLAARVFALQIAVEDNESHHTWHVSTGPVSKIRNWG